MDKSSKSEKEYDTGGVSQLPTMESITNTEDMLCNVLILALIVNDSLKSRVWENRKHGSVGVTIALKLNSILIWSKCYGFYLSKKIVHYRLNFEWLGGKLLLKEFNLLSEEELEEIEQLEANEAA